MAQEYGTPSRKSGGGVMVIMMTLVLVLAILVPIFAGPTQTRRCADNLKAINKAVTAWQEDTSASCDISPTEAQLLPFLEKDGINRIPACASGGTYDYGTVDSAPTCTVHKVAIPPS